MTFTSADTYHRRKINEDIVRIMQMNRGVWMTAAEISDRIKGRTDSRGVGHRMQYLVDEFPIETAVNKSMNPHRRYRYVGGETA